MDSENVPFPPDLISRLPDPLLCSIISRLKIEEAVQTGILSNRWKGLWKYSPALEFNPITMVRSLTSIPPNYNSRSERAMDIVDDIMAAHKAALRSCKLVHFRSDSGLDENQTVSRWLDRLKTDKSIEELEIERIRTTPRRTLAAAIATNTMSFPENSFRCRTLRVLVLTNYVFPDASPFHGCENLGTLRLAAVRMSDETLARVLICCARLENLSLQSCSGFNELRIFGENLRVLEVEDLVVERMEVRARGLRVMSVDSITAATPRIAMSVPSLTVLQVGDEGRKWRRRDRCRREGRGPHTVMDFLERCCGILDFDNAGLGYNVPIENLMELSISLDTNKIESQIILAKIFRVCRRLKKLSISVQVHSLPCIASITKKITNHSSKPVSFDKSTFWDNNELSDSLSYHVKVVSIKGFRGSEIEVDFSSYLIRNAPMLEKLSIEFCKTMGMNKEAQDLLESLPRASLDLDIIFSSYKESKENIEGGGESREGLRFGLRKRKFCPCRRR